MRILYFRLRCGGAKPNSICTLSNCLFEGCLGYGDLIARNVLAEEDDVRLLLVRTFGSLVVGPSPRHPGEIRALLVA